MSEIRLDLEIQQQMTERIKLPLVFHVSGRQPSIPFDVEGVGVVQKSQVDQGWDTSIGYCGSVPQPSIEPLNISPPLLLLYWFRFADQHSRRMPLVFG